jgi:hypothetical protein
VRSCSVAASFAAVSVAWRLASVSRWFAWSIAVPASARVRLSSLTVSVSWVCRAVSWVVRSRCAARVWVSCWGVVVGFGTQVVGGLAGEVAFRAGGGQFLGGPGEGFRGALGAGAFLPHRLLGAFAFGDGNAFGAGAFLLHCLLGTFAFGDGHALGAAWARSAWASASSAAAAAAMAWARSRSVTATPSARAWARSAWARSVRHRSACAVAVRTACAASSLARCASAAAAARRRTAAVDVSSHRQVTRLTLSSSAGPTSPATSDRAADP